MITYQLTSMAIGVSLAAIILFLVRRDHLHGPYAIWWIGSAATVALLGLFPRLFDTWAAKLGISYPPILAIVLGFGLLLLKILTMDLERSRQERLIRRLTQRLAMLEVRESSLPLPTPTPAETHTAEHNVEKTESKSVSCPPLSSGEKDRN